MKREHWLRLALILAALVWLVLALWVINPPVQADPIGP